MPVETALLRREADHLSTRALASRPGSEPPIRVFAVDNHPLSLRGLSVMLATEGCCQWLGDAATPAQALSQIPVLEPELVVLEHRLPELDGVALIEALRPLCPRTRFLLLTSHLEGHEVRRAMQAGAHCVLQQSVDATELMLAVRAVHGGQRHMTAPVAAALDEGEREALARNDLTRRELALLALMAQGLENRAIAAELNIAVPTVKFHITNIMSKLHAPNRTAAVLVALRSGLVTLNTKAGATN